MSSPPSSPPDPRMSPFRRELLLRAGLLGRPHEVDEGATGLRQRGRVEHQSVRLREGRLARTDHRDVLRRLGERPFDERPTRPASTIGRRASR